MIIQSCSSYKSGNFLKQKFLSGQLQSVYPEGESENDFVVKKELKEEVLDFREEDISQVETIDSPQIIEQETEKAPLKYMEDNEDVDDPISGGNSRAENTVIRRIKKYHLKRGGGNLSWTVPLAITMFVLGALALFLFFVIGWWAFAVAGGFFILGIVFMSLARPPSARSWGGKVATAIGMAAVGAAIIVLAIIVLLIWLIVWLLLLIFT